MNELNKRVMRMEAALAEIAEALEKASGARGLAGIHTAIADATEALQSIKTHDMQPLVDAIMAISPSVHVNLPPIPQPVVHVAQPAKFTVTIHGAYGGQDRVMTIERAA